jgi:von Willebrand factor A domain-containing protein 7
VWPLEPVAPSTWSSSRRARVLSRAPSPSPTTLPAAPKGSGRGLGKPALCGRIVGTSKSGTTLTATLQLTDNGTGAAQHIAISQITLQTLSGTGTVTLTSPALPLSVGNLAIGAFTNVTLTLNVPGTVTKFSITEKGTLQNIAGSTSSFALAEVAYP